MKQLHTSYHNLGSWKVIRDSKSSVIRILFDQRIGIITSTILFVVCSAVAFWLYGINTNSGNDGARIAGVWILAITGILTPLFIIAHGIAQRKKGDLIQYDIKNDVLELPRISTSIDHARARVHFSSEHFTDMSNHFFELNIIIDGQRTKFLSSSVSNGFRNIVEPLNALGFSVNHQKIKIK